jgi:hypothetical protein
VLGSGPSGRLCEGMLYGSGGEIRSGQPVIRTFVLVFGDRRQKKACAWRVYWKDRKGGSGSMDEH